MVGKSCAVMGGTDIIPTLYSGTVNEIRSETQNYLDIFSESRYIFSCSCSIQRGVPLDSVKEMCRTVFGG